MSGVKTSDVEEQLARDLLSPARPRGLQLTRGKWRVNLFGPMPAIPLPSSPNPRRDRLDQEVYIIIIIIYTLFVKR